MLSGQQSSNFRSSRSSSRSRTSRSNSTVSRTKGSVLVTGADGFIGQWIVRTLLQRGYKVRGTVISLPAASQLKKDYPSIKLFEANLSSGSKPFETAMQGCVAVVHTAMPYMLGKDITQPAVTGMGNVMNAAIKSGIKRVVVTSSLAAVVHDRYVNSETPYTEKDWNDTYDADKKHYSDAKVLSEKKAWQMAKDAGVNLTVIVPTWVYGPMHRGQTAISIEFMKSMLDGTLKNGTSVLEFMKFSAFNVVDVRDVALAHVRAIEVDEAIGKRFIVGSEKGYTVAEVASMMHKRFGEYELPLKAPAPYARITLSNKQARKILKFRPRPIDATMCDMAQAAIDYGLVTRK